MKNYPVTVFRQVTQSVEVEVEACDLNEARNKALEMAGGLDFTGREKEAVYEVDVHACVPKHEGSTLSTDSKSCEEKMTKKVNPLKEATRYDRVDNSPHGAKVSFSPGNGTKYELFFVGPISCSTSDPFSLGVMGSIGESAPYLVVCGLNGSAMLIAGNEQPLSISYVNEKLRLRHDEDGAYITQMIAEYLGRPYQRRDGTWT